MVAARDSRTAEAGAEIVNTLGLIELPVTVEHGRIAREAWTRFGKGRHPAGLNFGDCFAYAAAVAEGRPLLFKGDDFARTDVVVAPY